MKIFTFDLSSYSCAHISLGCIRALRNLGHIVKAFPADRPMEEFKWELLDFRPDFIFTIDHNGLDPGLLIDLKIPFVSWFVDNPFYWITKDYLSPYYLIFCWERYSTERLKESGFKAFYLPLCSDPNIFRDDPGQRRDYGGSISFVGSSGRSHYLNYYQKYREWVKDPEDRIVCDKTIELQIENPYLNISDILEETQRALGHTLSFKEIPQEVIQMCLEGVASSLYRVKVIEGVSRFGISVYGDEGWRELIQDDRVKLLGKIDYYELPKLYKMSKINLNITRVNHKSGVNPRVFDILCAGGFVLTDYRRDLGELFELGKEIVYYRDMEELKELVEYFLKHPEERIEIAQRAKARVLKDHTFEQRMEEAVRILRETFNL